MSNQEYTLNLFDNLSIHYIVLAAVLFISSLIIWQSFPKAEEYSSADEGTYYRQAIIIKNQGIAGFKPMAEGFLSDTYNQGRPSPLRVLHIYICSWLLTISDAIESLSYYSLVSFLFFCISLFFFVKKFWDINIALIATILEAFSPLTCALAKRALLDGNNYLICSLVLFSFILFIDSKDKKPYWLFISTLTISVLIKEINFIFAPFFIIIMLFLHFIQKDNKISIKDIALASLLPPSIIFIIYLFIFGSVGNVSNIINATLHPKFAIAASYASDYLSGPWYHYFIDYFLLFPIVSILFFMFIGKYILNPNHKVTNILLLFFIYFMACFSILPKTVRYAVNLNFIYTLFAALLLVSLISKYIKPILIQKIAITTVVIVISVANILTFYKFFVKLAIYDPVTFNLVKAEKMIPGTVNPSLATNTNPETDSSNKNDLLSISKNFADIIENPTHDKYINLSLSYYKIKMFNESIKMAYKAIEINPSSSTAYNNICSAYNDLQEWDKAIEAGKKALEIDPNFQLAKNNLAWAESQKAKVTKP